MHRLVDTFDEHGLERVAKVRVLYADTDKMGVVYHASYLRMMEQGRVELIRATGMAYADMEAQGFGLPVTDIAISYLAPACYDDIVSIEVALARLSLVRVFFHYRLCIEPGDRRGIQERLVLLRAETRHACVTIADGRPARLPDGTLELLKTRLR